MLELSNKLASKLIHNKCWCHKLSRIKLDHKEILASKIFLCRIRIKTRINKVTISSFWCLILRMGCNRTHSKCHRCSILECRIIKTLTLQTSRIKINQTILCKISCRVCLLIRISSRDLKIWEIKSKTSKFQVEWISWTLYNNRWILKTSTRCSATS